MKRRRPMANLTAALLLAAASAWAQLPTGPATVRIGSYDNFPKVFTNATGEVIGMFPDLLRHIAREEGWKLEWVDGTWKECLQRLEAGQIDLMQDCAVSEKRRERFDFSTETVFANWGTIYLHKGDRFDSSLDLQGKRVAVVRDSIHTEGRQGIKALLEGFGVECVYVELDDYAAAFAALDAGTADCWPRWTPLITTACMH